MRIYLIARIRQRYTGLIKYRLIDVDSKETKEVTEEDLITALETNSWAFKNVYINELKLITNEGTELCKLETKEGIQEIAKMSSLGIRESGKQYVLISIDLLKNTAKLVYAIGRLIDIDLDNILDAHEEIAGILSKHDSEYRKIIWAQPTEVELKLLHQTNKLYESFMIKTRALGLDCTFKYYISGNAVVLKSYMGTSKHAIVPKFIDVIDTRAFYNRKLTNLSLNNGLKVIGVRAFRNNNLTEVDIPKTVTRICKHAFHNNEIQFKMAERNKVILGDSFRIHNKNTTVSEQIEN